MTEQSEAHIALARSGLLEAGTVSQDRTLPPFSLPQWLGATGNMPPVRFRATHRTAGTAHCANCARGGSGSSDTVCQDGRRNRND